MAAAAFPTRDTYRGPASQAPSGTVYTPVPAGLRRPRGYIVVNGQKISMIDLQTDSVGHFSCDSFSGTTGLYSHPQGVDITFWKSLPPSTVVEVRFGLLSKSQSANEFPTGGNSESILSGLLDDVKLDLVAGTVSLSGRDLTARLIDAKSSTSYNSMTASQAVTMIAKQFGFTPQVTPTTIAIGRYSNNAYASTTAATPYWDSICSWARQENFDCFVTGATLYFGPQLADTDSSPWRFFQESDAQGRHWNNVSEIDLTRNANLSKDISVTVLSHSAKTGKSLAAYASRTGTRVPTSSRATDADTVANYVFIKPGLTQAAAQQWANTKFAAISSFELEMSVKLEGQPGLTVRKKVLIDGTGSDWDTSYYLKSIHRSWSKDEGYTMTLEGRNIPAPSGDNDDVGN